MGMHEPTRRSALVALAGTAAFAGTIGAALVAGEPAKAAAATADRSAWDQAFATYQRAKAEDDACNVAFNELWEKCKAAEEVVPHVTFGPDPFCGREIISTESTGYGTSARRMVSDLASGKRRHDPYPDVMAHEEFARRVAAVADERDCKIKAIRASFGMEEAEEEWEALGERRYAAEWALMDTPAPDLPALLWKIEHLFDEDGDLKCLNAEATAVALSDARRLLSHGRA
jgi:hypothetical protein